MLFLKSHKIFYHTSWICWDKNFHPKNKKNNLKCFQVWKTFLEENTEHIFAVTSKTKQELLNNYNLSSDKISIVYHSNKNEFYKRYSYQRKKNSFIYVGRLLPQKGVEEILEYFKNNQNATLTIIGDGKSKELVLKYANKCKNINYKEPICNTDALINNYKSHEYFILNSKKTKTWEELFGIVLIESMALGLIPIATNHSGPSEIISNKNGFLFDENELIETLDHIMKQSFNIEMSETNIIEAKKYTLQNISKRWSTILK
ncbi:glycosyltransferase [Neotamlana nanhaiensis]|uniref:glycosyltransferase n=1 Tax=Neotamlana nanhaiensis TaxID=1382798 RepID=UPI0012FF4B6E|nr:glycosyltransferase [Tamlana nanhaiensis]